ncbi:MAG TPA: hydrogenase iron-sulfur subunit [Sedimentisphaerales bacterium]|nr:hydrogenase iron-sulfur subunit [Sedimentisphaerales bacterium]
MIKKAEQTNGDVGIVLCDCAGTLRSRLDFDQLTEHLSGLAEVATVKLCSKFCQQKDCTKTIKSLTHIERLVIGACDREIFDKTLHEAIQSVNLNDGLLWSVNIREHCGWVAKTPKAATDKAKEALTAAVRRVKMASAVKSKKTSVNQNVLVLGGTVAAMQTATTLSQLGHHVTLVECSEKLGAAVAETPELYGYVASDWSQTEALVQNQVDQLIRQVKNDKQIRVQTSSTLKSLEGEFGNFTALVTSNGTEQKLSAGAIVLAPGPATKKSELAELVHNGEAIPKRIAIVMDTLGEQGKRVSAQVLSAAELLAKRFGAEVKLYCHNIRVAATGMEALYRRAREAGVVIVKYESPPTISDRGSKKVVSVEEPLIGYQVDEEFDLVVMADSAIADTSELLSLIEGLRPGPADDLQADSVWLLPTKTNREGIFAVGSAPDTDELRDPQTDGLATANEIHELLKNKQIEVLDDAAVVDEDKCVLCLTCMRICPHAAISIDIDNKAASVSAVTCQRCGICAAECPTGAIQLPRYSDEQVAAELGDKPQITVFACENSAYPAATAAATIGSQWGQQAQLIRVPCAGKVDLRDVLRALECGAQKVMILGCHLENCQYLAGSTRAAKRLERLNNALEKAGVDKKRVIFEQLASVEPHKFIEYLSENGV